MVSRFILDLHFPNGSCSQAPFHTAIGCCISYFEEYLFGLFTQIWLDHLFLLSFLSSLCILDSNPLSSEALAARVRSHSSSCDFALLTGSCAVADAILFFEFCFVSYSFGTLSTK